MRGKLQNCDPIKEEQVVQPELGLYRPPLGLGGALPKPILGFLRNQRPHEGKRCLDGSAWLADDLLVSEGLDCRQLEGICENPGEVSGSLPEVIPFRADLLNRCCADAKV